MAITPKEWEREAEGKKLVIPVEQYHFFEEKLNWREITRDFVKKNPLYFDKGGLWWSWNWSKDIYEMVDETDILIMIDFATNKYNLKAGLKTEIMEGLRRAAREFMPKEPKSTWIQFGEKIYDYETKEEHKASPKYFFTNSIPWSMTDTEETPVIDSLINDWCPESKEMLYEIFAYCTVRDYPINRLFVLIGSGANGKSTYLQILRKFIGESNVTSANLDMLADNSFHVAKLYKKLLCVMGETNFNRMKNTNLIKSLTGKDLVSIEFKNKTPFDAINYAKIVIATNSLPETTDKTDGFYRRWNIIEFKNRYDEKRDIMSEIPDSEFNALAKKSMRILSELMKERKFTGEGTIQNRKEKYEDKSNPLQAYIKAYYENEPNSVISAKEFYDGLSSYLQSNGLRFLTYQTVRAMMKDNNFEYEKHRVVGESNPVSCVIGLRRKKISDNYTLSVPDVPIVPPLPSHPTNMSYQLEHSGTAGTDGTDKLTKIRALYKGRYKDQAIAIEILKSKVNSLTDEEIAHYCSMGDLWECNPGFIKLI